MARCTFPLTLLLAFGASGCSSSLWAQLFSDAVFASRSGNYAVYEPVVVASGGASVNAATTGAVATAGASGSVTVRGVVVTVAAAGENAAVRIALGGTLDVVGGAQLPGPIDGGELTATADERGTLSVTAGVITAGGRRFRVSRGALEGAPGGGGWLCTGGVLAVQSEELVPAAPAGTPAVARAATVPTPTVAVRASAAVSASAESVSPVAAAVDRCAVGSGVVLTSGALSLSGLPADAGEARVIDGRLALEATSASPTRRITGGVLLISARGGRRYRARVTAGSLHVRAARDDGSFVLAGGALTVHIEITGGIALALAPEVPAPRTARAFDALLAAVPAGPAREAQAAAVTELTREGWADGPTLFEVPITGRTVVFVLDVSYSMSEPEVPGLPRGCVATKLDTARAELVKALAELPPGTRADVVAFSSDVHTLWDAPRILDERALASAVTWLAALRPLDETDAPAAVRAATALAPDQLVLVSDGRPSDGAVADRALEGVAVTLAQRGARFDVVGIGPDQDAAFIDALARDGHGMARHHH